MKIHSDSTKSIIGKTSTPSHQKSHVINCQIGVGGFQMKVSDMETIREFFSIDNIQEFHGVQ